MPSTPSLAAGPDPVHSVFCRAAGAQLRSRWSQHLCIWLPCPGSLGSCRKSPIADAASYPGNEGSDDDQRIGKLAARNSDGSLVKRRPVGRVQSEANFCTRPDLLLVDSAVEKLHVNNVAVADLDASINSANFMSGRTRSRYPVSGQHSSRCDESPVGSPCLTKYYRKSGEVSELVRKRSVTADGSTPSGSGNAGNFTGPLAVMLAALPPGKNVQAICSSLYQNVPVKKKYPSCSGSQPAVNRSCTMQMSGQPSALRYHEPPRKAASLINLPLKSGLMSHVSNTQSKTSPKKNCSMGPMAIAINEHEDDSPSYLMNINPSGGCALSPLSNMSERSVEARPPSEKSVSKLVKSKVKRAMSWIFGGKSEKVGMAENDAREEAKSEIASNPPSLLCERGAKSEGGIFKNRRIGHKIPSQSNGNECGERSGKAGSAKAEGTATKSLWASQ
eukprot:gene1472-32857_t